MCENPDILLIANINYWLDNHIELWLEQNMENRYELAGVVLQFVDSQEMIKFLLRWGN